MEVPSPASTRENTQGLWMVTAVSEAHNGRGDLSLECSLECLELRARAHGNYGPHVEVHSSRKGVPRQRSNLLHAKQQCVACLLIISI